MRIERLVALAGAFAASWGFVASVEAWRGDLAGAALMSPEASRLDDDAYRRLLERALTKSPAATIPLTPAVKGLSERGLEREARAIIDEALRRNAPFAARLLHAADLAASGHLAEAVSAFETLHRVAPADRTVVQYLIGLHANLGNAPRLEEVARESERLWPGGFDALVALKNAALARSDRRAATVLLRAAAASRDFPEPRIYERDAEMAALEALAALEGTP